MPLLLKLRGVSFGDCQKNINDLYYKADAKKGEPLNLVREPDNKFDANAISVRHSGNHLGYIPREDAVYIADMIDKGEEIIAKLESYNTPKQKNRSWGITVLLDTKN